MGSWVYLRMSERQNLNSNQRTRDLRPSDQIRGKNTRFRTIYVTKAWNRRTQEEERNHPPPCKARLSQAARLRRVFNTERTTRKTVLILHRACTGLGVIELIVYSASKNTKNQLVKRFSCTYLYTMDDTIKCF